MKATFSGLPLIMLIEDEIFIQQVINQCLKGKFKITTFANGLDAWSFLQEGGVPATIIADLNMPKISGLELLQQIKASSYFNAIPVLILSGEESSDIKIKCLEAGADDYMVKPFNPRELEIRVKKIIARNEYVINN